MHVYLTLKKEVTKGTYEIKLKHKIYWNLTLRLYLHMTKRKKMQHDSLHMICSIDFPARVRYKLLRFDAKA